MGIKPRKRRLSYHGKAAFLFLMNGAKKELEFPLYLPSK
jgi:hypothetical protein